MLRFAKFLSIIATSKLKNWKHSQNPCQKNYIFICFGNTLDILYEKSKAGFPTVAKYEKSVMMKKKKYTQNKSISIKLKLTERNAKKKKHGMIPSIPRR